MVFNSRKLVNEDGDVVRFADLAGPEVEFMLKVTALIGDRLGIDREEAQRLMILDRLCYVSERAGDAEEVEMGMDSPDEDIEPWRGRG